MKRMETEAAGRRAGRMRRTGDMESGGHGDWDSWIGMESGGHGSLEEVVCQEERSGTVDCCESRRISS